MINHSDILQLCRLCLVEEKVNHSIFEEAGGLRGIFLKITSCLPVSISQDDSLPKKICDSCSSKLDTFYQFWNETANAEKQLLQWLNQTTLGPISKAGQTESSKNKMDSAEVKEEAIEVVEGSYEELRMSSEAKTYVLQQQQLPYSATPSKVRPAVESNETEEPAPKRPRRASAMKALEHMGSEEEDDPDFDGDNYTKAESEESDKDDDEEEEDETYQEPSTSMDDQPGPSGMGKGSTDAPSIKECAVQLNEVGHLLDEDGYYLIPGKRIKWMTCYKCFQKFKSAEDLDIHKVTHEQESEEEKDKLTDSDAELDSESDGEEPEELSRSSRSSRRATTMKNSMIMMDSESDVEEAQATKNQTTAPVSVPEKAPQGPIKIAASPLVGSVKPIQRTPVNPVKPSTKSNSKGKKVPAINNIHIKCMNCDILFTNSGQLMEHKPVDPKKICCFTCKVCSENYSTPETYMEHIMQHNAFTPRNHVVVSKVSVPQANDPPKKYRYICVLCNSRFEDCYQLRRHEITVHDKKEEQVYQPNSNKSKVAASKDLHNDQKTDNLGTTPKVTPIEKNVTPAVLSTPNSEVAKKLTEATSKTVATNKVQNSAGKKRGRLSSCASTDTSNEKKAKTITKATGKNLVQGKLNFKPTVKENKPIQPKPTETDTSKKVADALSYNVLRTPPTEKKGGKVQEAEAAPSKKQPQVAPSSIKSEQLVCDICYDVFSDVESFEEHMEFHNNLDSSLMSKTTEKKDAGENPEESDDEVMIVEDESTSKIKAIKPDPISRRNGPQGKNQKAAVSKKKKAQVDSDDDNSDDLTIDYGVDDAVVGSKNKKFPTQCTDCKVTFKKHKSLRLHITKKILCSECDFITCKLPDARSHLLKEHDLHFCWRCKATFGKAELLKDHYKSDHTCSNCNRVVNDKEGHQCAGAD